MSKLELSLQRFEAWDRRVTERANRATAYRPVRGVFAIVSRLGDGVFWYVLMAVLLARYADAALQPVVHMIVVGVLCTLLYKWLKTMTSRPRPYCRSDSIALCVAPLDQFSFPSGHTLHAVSFTLIALHYYPALTWLLLPFAVLVALSRMVLGLHYPSDVLAGGLIGSFVGGLSLSIFG